MNVLIPLRPPWWSRAVKQIETIHFSRSNFLSLRFKGDQSRWNSNYPFPNGQTYKHTFSKNVKEIPAARRTCLERVAWPHPRKEWVETTLHWIKAASCFPAGIFYFHTNTVLPLSYLLADSIFTEQNQASKQIIKSEYAKYKFDYINYILLYILLQLFNITQEYTVQGNVYLFNYGWWKIKNLQKNSWNPRFNAKLALHFTNTVYFILDITYGLPVSPRVTLSLFLFLERDEVSLDPKHFTAGFDNTQIKNQCSLTK